MHRLRIRFFLTLGVNLSRKDNPGGNVTSVMKVHRGCIFYKSLLTAVDPSADLKQVDDIDRSIHDNWDIERWQTHGLKDLHRRDVKRGYTCTCLLKEYKGHAAKDDQPRQKVSGLQSSRIANVEVRKGIACTVCTALSLGDLDARQLHRCVGLARRRDVTSHHRQRRRTDPDTLPGKCNMTQACKNCSCPRSGKPAVNGHCAKQREKSAGLWKMWKKRWEGGTEGDNARDGDRSGLELGCEPVCTRGIVHRWICNDGKLADVSGMRG